MKYISVLSYPCVKVSRYRSSEFHVSAVGCLAAFRRNITPPSSRLL